jgi:hypothetical protein
MRTEAILHDRATATATLGAGKRGERRRYGLGLDMDLTCGVIAVPSAAGL